MHLIIRANIIRRFTLFCDLCSFKFLEENFWLQFLVVVAFVGC